MSEGLFAKIMAEPDRTYEEGLEQEISRLKEVIGGLKEVNAELLEALKAFDSGLRDGSIQFTKKRQADSDPYHPANTLMCAAFAKAEGGK